MRRMFFDYFHFFLLIGSYKARLNSIEASKFLRREDKRERKRQRMLQEVSEQASKRANNRAEKIKTTSSQ